MGKILKRERRGERGTGVGLISWEECLLTVAAGETHNIRNNLPQFSTAAAATPVLVISPPYRSPEQPTLQR
jgi:hypothetical protein